MCETGQPPGAGPVPVSWPSLPWAAMLGACCTKMQELAEALQG